MLVIWLQNSLSPLLQKEVKEILKVKMFFIYSNYLSFNGTVLDANTDGLNVFAE